MDEAETYAFLAEQYAEVLPHMRAVNDAFPDTYKAPDLALYERVAAGERVPPNEVVHAHDMVRIATLALNDARVANGRWDAETAWTLRFGQPEGGPH
jgi:hypothetical protein